MASVKQVQVASDCANPRAAESCRTSRRNAFCLDQGHRESEHFVVRIEWDSVDGHERGFRSSPGFGEFFQGVRPFFTDIEEMKHYQLCAPS